MKLTIDSTGFIDLVVTLESGRSERYSLGSSSHEAGDTLDGLIEENGIDEDQIHQLFPQYITLRLDTLCLDNKLDSHLTHTTTFRSRAPLLGLAISHWIDHMQSIATAKQRR